MRHYVLGFLLIMLASYSFAMHIIAPSKLAENAVLYFNVNFEDEQFDSVKILIDGKEVLQAFSNMQIAIFKKNVISAFFVDEDPNSNRLSLACCLCWPSRRHAHNKSNYLLKRSRTKPN